MRLRSDSYFRYYSTSDRVDLENKKIREKDHFTTVKIQKSLITELQHFSSESIQLLKLQTFIPNHMRKNFKIFTETKKF